MQGRVAVVQMVSSMSVQANLESLEPHFIQACKNNVKLLLLPENFSYMGVNPSEMFAIAEPYLDGPIQLTLSRLARTYGLWVIAGTIPIKTSERVSARCIVFDENGNDVAHYDKMHLFDVQVPGGETHQESLFIERGNEVVVIQTPVGRVGLSICYDLRFPELYRQMEQKGAEIFVVPAAFTAATGVAHWEVLLRARAIENLCYVLAANQGGKHENGRHTFGHSMIIEPWGSILQQSEAEGACLLVADIDLKRLNQLRQQFPCNSHHVL